MHEQLTQTLPTPGTWGTRPLVLRIAVIIGLTLLCSVLLPAVSIVLGVCLVFAVALHAWSPELRPYVDRLLRVPVARASTRHKRLTLAAGAGALLILSGAVGATVRGRLRSEWEQAGRQREVAEENVAELLTRARDFLDVGNVDGAELVLLDADAVIATGSGQRAEVDDLLERVRRSGDSEAILDILTRLPQDEFESFKAGESVPEALEFPERALTSRAVELALAQLDEAQQARADH